MHDQHRMRADRLGGGGRRFDVELNGLNTIHESERKGRPRDLFWPWFAANVSVFGLSYGSFLLGFGISFWQATIVGVVGIVISFLLCGFIALAGKRGSAPTMVLSRAVFGVERQPAAVAPLVAADGRAGRRCSRRSRCSRPRPCSPSSAGKAASRRRSSR